MSLAELQIMARAWKGHLEQAGLRIAWEEVVWWCSATDTLEAHNSVSDVDITRRNEGFKALRVWITSDGHFTEGVGRARGECMATLAARLLFMCCFIFVLVRRQLDTLTTTVHLSSGTSRQHVAQKDFYITETHKHIRLTHDAMCTFSAELPLRTEAHAR